MPRIPTNRRILVTASPLLLGFSLGAVERADPALRELEGYVVAVDEDDQTRIEVKLPAGSLWVSAGRPVALGAPVAVRLFEGRLSGHQYVREVRVGAIRSSYTRTTWLDSSSSSS